MSNHIVRADSRGNLRVITYMMNVSANGLHHRQALRATVPFSDPRQAVERCMGECEADRYIERLTIHGDRRDAHIMRALALIDPASPEAMATCGMDSDEYGEIFP